VFRNKGSSGGAANGTVTIIGPGVRIVGDVAFSGYLRVQGEVVGNITCTSDTHCTTVVHGAGSVTGAIKSPNIVVAGRVQGPLFATESIEIHDGASVVGDVRYKRLAIHEGGHLDGALVPNAASDQERLRQERRVARPEAPEIKELDGPLAHDRRATDRVWSARRIAIAAALLLAVGVAVWAIRRPAVEAPVAAGPAAPVNVLPAMPPRVEEPPVAPAPPSPPVPEPRTESKPAAPAPELPRADPNKVVTVQGTDLDKPADLFFVATREPVVLFKKLRSDTGDGTRIELPAGAKRRFPISENEVVRVAQGRNLDLFYQGRKLAPGTLHSGGWIGFVPLVEGKPAAQ
jgi:cytoskeletal protein CcmA (bactofilin family)